MKRRLGDPDEPLLVSVRSGAKFSMPGMMDTVLNLGSTTHSVKGLARAVRRALRLRLVPPLHRLVRPHRAGHRRRAFDAELERAKSNARVTSDAELPAEALKDLCSIYRKLVKSASGRAFPRTRSASCGVPSRPCSARGTAPGAPTAAPRRSRTTWAPR